MDESEWLEFIQKFNNTIGIEDFEYGNKRFKELLLWTCVNNLDKKSLTFFVTIQLASCTAYGVI